MIPPRYSHLIAGLLPHAAVKIYPDAAHGFLFQHHAEFAADVTEFLNGETQGPFGKSRTFYRTDRDFTVTEPGSRAKGRRSSP